MIGLEIGQTFIRICEMEGSFGRYKFSQNIEEPVAIGDSPLLERQRNAIDRALGKLDRSKVVTNIPSTFLSLRKIQVPFTDLKKVEMVLPSTIEDLVPFEIDDLHIQHHVLDISNDSSDILALLIPKQYIVEHLEMLKSIAVEPQHLVVDGDILSIFASTGIQALLHLTENEIVCALYKDGKTLSFRNLTFEEDAFIEEEQRLSSKMIERIRRTFIQFEDLHQVDTDKIILSGFLAYSEDFQDQVEEVLGVEVGILTLPENMDSKWALAYALAQKGAGVTHGRVFDLRQGEFSYQGNLQRVAGLIQGIALLSLLGLIGYGGYFWKESTALEKSMVKIEEQIATQVRSTMPDVSNSMLASPSKIISTMQDEIAQSTEKLDKLGSITSSEPPVTTLLKNVSEGMPAHSTTRVDVTELMISKTSINLKLETDGFGDATSIEQSLKKMPQFKQAQKADEKTVRNGIQFSITIPLQIEEEEE